MERKKEILLVVDMQKDFVDGALGTKEAELIIPKVVEKINSYKENKNTIIATMDTHEENYLESQEGVNLPVVHCVRDTEGWQINEKVKEALPIEAIYLDKPTFGSTKLVDMIDTFVYEYGESNVSVEIIGLCTDICVVSNALLLKAFYPEMPISIDPECCAGVTVESHNAALTTMKMCQILLPTA